MFLQLTYAGAMGRCFSASDLPKRACMERRPTIKDIAREAGVHHATVSRALRGLPNVAAATRKRVEAAASLLEYRPDPMMHALAAYRSTTRPVHYKETIAFLWPEQTREQVAASRYYQRSLEGAKARAEELGYLLDEFWLRETRPQSLPRVLQARGIRGLIVAGYNRLSAAHLGFSIEHLAVASMTSSLKAPRLHRVGHDHFAGVRLALHELKRAGYSRIAMLLGEVQDRILEHRYSASFLLNHPLGLEKARKLLRVVVQPSSEEMRATIEQMHADCLLMSFTPAGPPYVESAGERVPIISLDLLPDNKGFSGIDQQLEQAASNAVDLVAEQLLHGRLGVPQSSKIILTSGRWIQHPSLGRRRTAAHQEST
jgi:LacI family transcriptional regulator